MEQVATLKRTWYVALVLQIAQKNSWKLFLKLTLVISINYPSFVNDLVNHGMVKNTKTWISRERNITFLKNKKILKLCLRWRILRKYRFLAEVTFNTNRKKQCKQFLMSTEKIMQAFFFFDVQKIQCKILLMSTEMIVKAILNQYWPKIEYKQFIMLRECSVQTNLYASKTFSTKIIFYVTRKQWVDNS